MRIVLLGSTGEVGWELQRALAPLGEVIALDRDLPPGRGADFADPAALATRVRGLAADAIVNAAAYTAVDQAEREPELARIINAQSPAVLARLTADSGAWLVHYSTDYVFDGSGTTPRGEDAVTEPLSVYGATKLAGEQAIRASGCRHLILRTSWVHSARGGTFARTMLGLAAQRDSLRVVDDQVGAPTGADLLADVTAHTLRAASVDERLAGTYHACASGETNWPPPSPLPRPCSGPRTGRPILPPRLAPRTGVPCCRLPTGRAGARTSRTRSWRSKTRSCRC